jgi:hypothetical protein
MSQLADIDESLKIEEYNNNNYCFFFFAADSN